MSIKKIANEIFVEVIGRLQKVAKLTHEYEVAELLGFKKDTFATRKFRGSLPRKEIEIACAKNGWSFDWVMTGLGPIYPGSEVKTVQFDDSVEPPEDFILVPRYNVAGSAGGGAVVGHEEVTEYLSFRREWVKNSLRIQENQLAVINVIGDSMEPRLRDGDVVLLDMSVHGIVDNSIYALQFNGGLSIKRVQRFMSGAVEIISDNKTYKTEVLTPDEARNVKVIGRVVWAGGRV